MEVDVLTQHPKLIPCSEQKQVYQGAQRRNKNPDFAQMVVSLADCFVGRMYFQLKVVYLLTRYPNLAFQPQ
jgi:hypothetical protein